jgi:hypothetical protein
MKQAHCVCFNLYAVKSCHFNRNLLRTCEKFLFTRKFCGCAERRTVICFPWICALSRKDPPKETGPKLWFSYVPSTFLNIQGAHKSVSRVLQFLKRSPISERALVHKNVLPSFYLLLLEDFKQLLEHFQLNWKVFIVKFWSLENYWREQVRRSVPKWKARRHLLKSQKTVELLESSSRNNASRQSHCFFFPRNVPSSIPLLQLRRHVDDGSSISSNGLVASKKVGMASTTLFKPIWMENIRNSIQNSFLSNSPAHLLFTKLKKEPTFKVHSLLYWQMEVFPERDSLPHLKHFRWKFYPKRLREQRMVKGSHLFISKWNKAVFTFSIIILRSATDTLWFILRPVLIEGYHILQHTIRKALGLFWTDRNDISTSEYRKRHLVPLKRNVTSGIQLENSMKDFILSNFSSFWKFERALSKISRKAIVWGFVEEEQFSSSFGGKSPRKKDLSTETSFRDEQNNSYSSLVLGSTAVVLFLFPLLHFPTSEHLVNICTLGFQLLAVYTMGVFGAAAWRVLKESEYFIRLYETLQSYLSTLLRHSLTENTTTTNKVVDIVAWCVDDVEEQHSLCAYFGDWWEESVCRAEMILRKIPLVVAESKMSGWKLLSLFEQENL